MNAESESHASRPARHNDDSDQLPPRPRPATGPRQRPSPVRSDTFDRPAQLDPCTLGPISQVLDSYKDLTERPWNLALLLALEDGPTTAGAAYTGAIAWAEGHLPDADLTAVLTELVHTGLALHLGGQGEAALFAATTAGRRLLDRLEQAAFQSDLLNDLADLGDSLLLHGRLLQLTPTEARILAQVVHGRNDQQIAHSVSLSRRSVEDHVSRILKKLDMASRNVLIARLTIESIEF